MTKLGGRLNGKTALITGAGSVGKGWGDGRAIAGRFAEEGAQVVTVDRNRQALIETLDLIRAFDVSGAPWPFGFSFELSASSTRA